MDQLTHNSETSLSLLERARQADAAAWKRLVQIYSPLIFHWVRRCGFTDERAADLVQDVWAAVTPALGRFQRDHQTGTFRGWLWTITRNKIRDQVRHNGEAVAPGGTDARLFLEALPESEPDEGSGETQHALLHRALHLVQHDFEPQTWQAFWMMTVEDRRAAEIGEALGLAANAVHQARFRVLKRLREELAGLVEVL